MTEDTMADHSVPYNLRLEHCRPVIIKGLVLKG